MNININETNQPLPGHVLTAEQYLNNCFKLATTTTIIKKLYYSLTNYKNLNKKDANVLITELQNLILNEEQLKTYENMLLSETEFKEIAILLEQAGMTNLSIKYPTISGVIPLKTLLKVSTIYEVNDFTEAKAEINKEKTALFVELIKKF